VEVVGTGSTAETEGKKPISSREWVPIVPSSTPHTQRPPAARASASQKYKKASATTASDGPSLITTPITDAADTAADTTDATPTSTPTPTAMPASTKTKTGATRLGLSNKLSRRERILHLARQNARTPLPEPAETPQPPPLTEVEKLDEESERQGKERTIRERLWRLVGGNY